MSSAPSSLPTPPPPTSLTTTKGTIITSRRNDTSKPHRPKKGIPIPSFGITPATTTTTTTTTKTTFMEESLDYNDNNAVSSAMSMLDNNIDNININIDVDNNNSNNDATERETRILNRWIALESALQVYWARRGGLYKTTKASSSSSTSPPKRMIVSLDTFYGLARKLPPPPPAVTNDDTRSMPPPHNQEPSSSVSMNQEGSRKRPRRQLGREDMMLNQEEQVLHDWMRIACPALYRLEKNDLEDRWYVQQQPFAGNRIQELQRLVELHLHQQNNHHQLHHDDDDNNNNNDSDDHRIWQAICENRHRHDSAVTMMTMTTTTTTTKDTAHAAVPAALAMTPTVTAAVSWQPGTTVEERVRARAHVRQQQVQEQQQQADSKESDSDNDDPEWLLALADALWLHSNGIVLRQARLISPWQQRMQQPKLQRQRPNDVPAAQPNRKPKLCCLTLQDAIVVLQKNAALAQKHYAGRRPSEQQLPAQKSSRRMLALGLQALVRILPEFITMKDSPTDNIKTTTLSTTNTTTPVLHKDTTVWLQPADYKTIRSRLTGTKVNKPMLLTLTTPAPPSSPLKRSLDNGNRSDLAPPLPPTVEHHAPKRLRREEPGATGLSPVSSPFSLFVPPHTSSERHGDESMPPPSPQAPSSSFSEPFPDSASANQTYDQDATAVPRQQSTTHRRPRRLRRKAPPAGPVEPMPKSSTSSSSSSSSLRVNPHLIWSDADYAGGEVISLSSTSPFSSSAAANAGMMEEESPRGLKRLFDRMKAGRRI